MRICTICKIEKAESEFYKDRSNKDGYKSSCKICQKKYEGENRDKILEYQRIWRKENKDKIKKYSEENRYKLNEYSKNYAEVNKESRKIYYQKNKESIKERTIKYQEENKDAISERKKEYYKKNRERIKKYQQDNRERINEYNQKWKKEKMNSDPLYKLSSMISTLISRSIKNQGYKKESRTFEILGCSFEEFKIYIESKFQEGMCWSNHGDWHFDHIIPISLAQSEEDVYRLNHYSNFQPLWAFDNISKGNRTTIN